jgi:hypothetical protein
VISPGKGERGRDGSLDGNTLSQLETMAVQLRPYLVVHNGWLGVCGLDRAAAQSFCAAAGIPLSMLNLRPDLYGDLYADCSNLDPVKNPIKNPGWNPPIKNPTTFY